MIRFFLLLALSFFLAANAVAQDDDMYFAPKKTQVKTTIQSVRKSEVTEPYDYRENSVSDDSGTYHSGSIRDVDEYNRRNRSYKDEKSTESTYAGTRDSILVSMEDYENSMKMKRFDGYNNITLIINDPWYYDAWFYDPWYYGSWSWHFRWHDPWYYSFYDPWYYSPGWYGHWGGYYGWYWGWGHTWHHHHHPHYSYWGGSRPYYSSRGGYNSGRWATADRAERGMRRSTYTGSRNYNTSGRSMSTNSRRRSNSSDIFNGVRNNSVTRNRQNNITRNYSTPTGTRNSSYGGGSHSFSRGGSIGGGSRSYGGGGSRGGRR